MKILLYGSTGWIGGKLLNIIKDKKIDIVSSTVRLDDYGSIGKELDCVKPTHVVLAAGLTGRPNVDWCEDHKDEVLRVNVIGTSVLADECRKRCIHLTYFGTGCIYEYDKKHPYGEEEMGFTECDEPNFDKSYYSKTKIITEKILKECENTLILRIRMPLSDDLHHRNFITKITKYANVVNIPNSMTVLTEFLPISIDMLINNKTGVYNFTNPGVISHNQILALYKKYIDPTFTWKNFTLEEQGKILKAGRSNNCLNVTKLCNEYQHIQHIDQAIIGVFQRMKNNLNK